MKKMEVAHKVATQNKISCYSTKHIPYLFILILILILFHTKTSLFIFASSPSSSSWAFFPQWKGKSNDSIDSDSLQKMAARLRDSVTFLPLKDLRFEKTAMTGNTWFMSSMNNTYEDDEAEYLYFPSQESKGRLLCLRGHDSKDGTKNSYALAWPESLPDSATLMEGLTFVSDTYYDYGNLWHGLSAMAPFVGWSMKNGCEKPKRWVLFHWGELRYKMGLWLQNLMTANFREVEIEGFSGGERTYCFEKAAVMRHGFGGMGEEKKLKVFDLLRCKAREFCGLKPEGRGKEVNENGEPIIRLTLLMRRGSRSFKNATTVVNVFAKECAKVEGCVLEIAQSEDLSFCDQVKVMTNTDIVASPHGAQLTNLLFMDRDSSVMEFFPKGWLEHAGVGQYVYHWMANESGMKHQGAWRDTVGEECPFPKQDLQCFFFYKDGKIGHNETFFAEWALKALDRVRLSKLGQPSKNSASKPQLNSNSCRC